MIGKNFGAADAAMWEALVLPMADWWGRVAASPTYIAARRVPMPEWGNVGEALGTALRAGWQDARDTVAARVQKTLPRVLRQVLADRRLFAGARAPDAATLATRTVIRRLEDVTLDEEMIERYVATRVPPLTWAVEEQARRALAARVGRAASQGLAWTDIRKELGEDYGLTRWHAENVARTELATMYSNGSLVNYMQTDVVTKLQFMAILDSRTTPVCARLNGRVFTAAEATARVTPPLHYQCRSLLSPVMGWEAATAESLDEAFAGAGLDELPFEGFGVADLPDIEPYSLSELVAPDLATATGETKKALSYLAGRAAAGWR